LDNTQDEDSGKMQDLLDFFDPTTTLARDPNTLHTVCRNESDLSTHAYAILQQDDVHPGTLGRISILHGVKVFLSHAKIPMTLWHG
jgi:hypothetical protein